MLQICAKFYFLMLALRGGKTETDCSQAICVTFTWLTVKFAETCASEYFSSLIKTHLSPQCLKVCGKLCLNQNFKTKFVCQNEGKVCVLCVVIE